jgi:hypothetical protein
MNVRRLLIIVGLALVAAGAFWPVIRRTGLGRLPGDIVIHRPGIDFYFPIVSSIVVSIVLSLIFWLLRK